jgi:ABC-type enterochelin transport system permease subunit
MVPFACVADDRKRLSRQALFSLCALCCIVSLLEHSFTCSTHCFVVSGSGGFFFFFLILKFFVSWVEAGGGGSDRNKRYLLCLQG